jgi:hypothetical protein
MTIPADNALAERYATITSDHDRIHQALYHGFAEPFCPSPYQFSSPALFQEMPPWLP